MESLYSYTTIANFSFWAGTETLLSHWIRLISFFSYSEMKFWQFLLLQTMKSFFEETLVAIPDSVLDSPIAGVSSGREDIFANVQDLLPPPYDGREQELLYA